MADSKPPEGNAPQLSLPAQARDAAQLVAGLPDHMFLSYESDDPRQRVSRIKAANNEILAGIGRIIPLLEMHHPGAAEPLKARLQHLSNGLEEVVAQEMPEYEGGKRREPSSSTPSAALNQALQLTVVANLTAESIRTIADELEARQQVPDSNQLNAKLDDILEQLAVAPGQKPSTDKPIGKKEQQIEWLTRALSYLRDHPGWSNAKIARLVGKHPSTLSRNETYKKAVDMARGNKEDRHQGHITADPETGQLDVEAYTNDPEEPEWDD